MNTFYMDKFIVLKTITHERHQNGHQHLSQHGRETSLGSVVIVSNLNSIALSGAMLIQTESEQLCLYQCCQGRTSVCGQGNYIFLPYLDKRGDRQEQEESDV